LKTEILAPTVPQLCPEYVQLDDARINFTVEFWNRCVYCGIFSIKWKKWYSPI